MEENKNLNEIVEERTYTQSEVDAIVSQYRIKFEQLQKSAREEIGKRDMSNFYQTLTILFEVVRNKEAYSKEFSDKCVSLIEDTISSMFVKENKNNE